MTLDGFRISVNNRSEAEVRLVKTMAEEKEIATLDDRVSELFAALRAPIFQYLTGVFGRTSAGEVGSFWAKPWRFGKDS